MVRFLSVSVLAVASFVPLALGAPHAPESFDYVVVGGGAAGSIVAARLSESSNTSVLLLEAGPNDTGLENVEIPYIYANLFMSQYDYNYTLTPQSNLNDRVLPYFRGRLLGGSTSINGMTYTRGPASDWDRLASHLGDQSWSWNSLQSYFRKNEAFRGPPGGPSNPARFTPSVHGTQGAIGVSLNQATEWIIPPTLEAAQQVGIAYNEDGNSGNPLGVSWQQFAIKDGKRSSAATGYLTPQVRGRRNLAIRVDSVARRVLRSSGNGRKFDTVEYTTKDGSSVQVTARREVILSAGVVDTPTLLMRSGLGPAADLRAAGITPIVDIPALGKNFVEHIGLPMTWSANSSLTDDELDRRDTPLYDAELAKWRSSGTGRLTQTSLTHIMFDRVPANASIWQTEQDPSGSANAPHYEQIVSNKWTSLTPAPSSGHYVGMTHFVTTPTSRGEITLNPADPNGMPLINPRSLTTQWDKFVLRHAIRRTLAYMNAPAWDKFDIQPQFQLEESASDDEVDAFIRSNAFGGAHGVSTARIGRANSPAGTDVVGPDFRVKGVQGLRIVDASVIPFMPNGHSMAPVYIVAEKASDIIRQRP